MRKRCSWSSCEREWEGSGSEKSLFCLLSFWIESNVLLSLKPQWALLSNILDGSARWCFFIPNPYTTRTKEATKKSMVLQNSSKLPSFWTLHILLPMFLFSTDTLVVVLPFGDFLLQTSTTLLTIFLNGNRHRWLYQHNLAILHWSRISRWCADKLNK